GMRAGAHPSLFLCGVATLSLIVEVADKSPLVVIADDFQWLDLATSSVLNFVARRLESTHILLIVGVREPSQTTLGSHQTPEINVSPLNDTASAILLRGVAPDLALQATPLS